MPRAPRTRRADWLARTRHGRVCVCVVCVSLFYFPLRSCCIFASVRVPALISVIHVVCYFFRGNLIKIFREYLSCREARTRGACFLSKMMMVPVFCSFTLPLSDVTSDVKTVTKESFSFCHIERIVGRRCGKAKLCYNNRYDIKRCWLLTSAQPLFQSSTTNTGQQYFIQTIT